MAVLRGDLADSFVLIWTTLNFVNLVNKHRSVGGASPVMLLPQSSQLMNALYGNKEERICTAVQYEQSNNPQLQKQIPTVMQHIF